MPKKKSKKAVVTKAGKATKKSVVKKVINKVVTKKKVTKTTTKARNVGNVDTTTLKRAKRGRVAPYVGGVIHEGKELASSRYVGDKLVVTDTAGVSYTLSGTELVAFKKGLA